VAINLARWGELSQQRVVRRDLCGSEGSLCLRDIACSVPDSSCASFLWWQRGLAARPGIGRRHGLGPDLMDWPQCSVRAEDAFHVKRGGPRAPRCDTRNARSQRAEGESTGWGQERAADATRRALCSRYGAQIRAKPDAVGEHSSLRARGKHAVAPGSSARKTPDPQLERVPTLGVRSLNADRPIATRRDAPSTAHEAPVARPKSGVVGDLAMFHVKRLWVRTP
jgi:hypothetical protein